MVFPLTPRHLLLSFLFLSPSLYLHFHSSSWKSHVNSSPPPPRYPVLSGLSLTSSKELHSIPIAICLAGHLRTFPHPPLRNSLLINLLTPLRTANYTPHIFFHTSVASNSKNRKDSIPETSFQSLLHLLSPFHPLHLSFFANSPPSPLPSCSRFFNHTPRLSSSLPLPLLRSHQCMQQIRAYERQSGETFQWIYKSRPDVALGSALPLPSALRNDTVYMNQHIPGTSTHAHDWLRSLFPKHAHIVTSPVGDHVWIGSREVMEQAMDAVAAFDDCQLYDLPSGTLNVEVGLTFWLAKLGVRYENRDWFWMLVREDGPECFRVKWIKRGVEKLVKRCMSYRDTGIIE